jgi:hypothetical protein
MLKLDDDIHEEPILEVFGISAHVREYRICWALNRSLGLKLARVKDLVVNRSDKDVFFARFEDLVDEGDIRYVLIQNIVPDGLLVPDLKQADFIFIVLYGEDIPPKEHYSALQKTEFVNVVFSLDPASWKNKYAALGVDGY